jgi:Multiubiquitin
MGAAADVRDSGTNTTGAQTGSAESARERLQTMPSPENDPADVEGRIAQDVAAIEEDEDRLQHDVERLENDLEERRPVKVEVNNKPVELPRHRVSGLQIKDAAIDQGVQIDLGFQLWEELGEGRERQIGDTDEVTVRQGTRFTAIAPDDNS